MDVNTDVSEMSTGEKAALGGGVLAVVGAFLPWVTVLGFSVSGVDGDGIITLFLGLVVVGAVLIESTETIRRGATGVLGVLIGLIGMLTFSSIGEAGAMASPGIGLYLTVLAAVAIVAGAVIGFAPDDGQEQQSEPTA